ncbi:MAG TPA: X2-like carbohydrate binding domain-containing protein, partial [Clostridia bacterium]
MRKVVSILVSLMLLVSIVSQSAFATTPTMFGITVGNVEGSVGSTVKVPVSFLNGAALAVNNVDFKLAYDPNVLELISIDPGEIASNPTVNFSSYISSGKASLLFVDETGGKEPISKSGVFANLNFKIITATKSLITFYSLGALNQMQLSKSSGFSLIEGSVAGTEVSTQNSVTPGNVKVDKAALTDVSVAVAPESNFADIQNGSISLIKDTDYTVSGSNVVIKKSYLNYYFTKFPEQNLNLDVVFKSGNNAKLCIYSGTSSLPSISPSTITYNVESNEDIAVKTELNGNYISSVTAGEKVSLLPRIDYTYSTTNNTTIIRKGFLQSYFNTNRSQAKLVINFTGGSNVTLTVNPLYPQQPHNELSPASATFEAGKASDIVVTKIPGGTNFVGITYKVQTLTDGKDYTVSGDKVTLKASFLNTLPVGDSALVFVSTPGNKVNFNITVTKPQVTTNAGITVTVGSAKVDADNIAVVPVSFSNITTPINNIDFKLSYDEKAFSTVTLTSGEIVPNTAVNFTCLASNGRISFLFA